MKARAQFVAFCFFLFLPFLINAADTLRAHPEVHLDVVASPYEPFVFEQNNKLVGFDIDIMDLVCRLNNWTYSVDLVSFREMLRKISIDSADIAIGSVYITDERRERFSYSRPYLNTGLVVISRTSEPVHTIEELSGKRVGVKTEAAGEEYATSLLRRHPGLFDIQSFEATDSSFAALQRQTVDAVFNDFINSQFIIADHYQGEFTIGRKWQGPNLLTKAQLGYPVSDAFHPRLQTLNHTLEMLEENGMLHQIREKWLIHTLHRNWSAYIPIIVTVVIVILAGLVLFLWYFRRRVTLRNRRYFQEILTASSDIIAVINSRGEIEYINESVETILGIAPDDLISENIFDYSEDSDTEQLAEFYNEAKSRQGSPVSMTLTFLDTENTPHEFAVKGRLIQDGSGADKVIVNARDITEMQEAERALRHNVTKYRALIESANDPIFIVKADTGIIVDANNEAAKLIGRSLPEIIGTNQTALHPPEQKEKYTKVFRTHVTAGSDLVSNVYVRDANGEDIPVEISSSTVEIEDEVYVQEIFRDLRPHKRAQEEIRLFQNAVESVKECISITDMEDQILFVNQAFENTYGYSRNEIIGKNISVIRCDTPEDREDERKEILTETIRGGWSGEIINQRSDGSTFPVRLSTSVIRDEDGKKIALIGVAQDITDEKQMEEELFRAEKLESLGTLAGGIAHDFNNILTSVIGNLSLAKSYLENPEKLKSLLITAEQSAVRATTLTKQMLTFSKGGQPVAEDISIRTLLQKAVDLSLSGSNVKYNIDLKTDNVLLHVDSGQMRQAIGNILLNAVQAMPEGGTVDITAEAVEFNSPSNSIGLAQGEHLRITIADTGPGITAENMDKIFDPFFTTKPRGSGLGLATSYSIVKRHGGIITADSVVDEGTTFYVYLPLTSTARTGEKGRTSGGDNSLKLKTGKILIMDDEQSVREVCGDMLEYLGYQVEYAENGEDALYKYKRAAESGEPMDVVIMDLTIPGGMGGIETVEKLLSYDDNARAIVSSGYSTNPVMSDYQEYGFVGVVNKPYQLADLKQEIQRVLKGEKV